MKLPSSEEMAKEVAEKALNEYIYKGKTLREWIDILNQTRWIPLSERLPKDRQMVLFCDIEDDIKIGYHIKGRPDTHFSQDGTFDDIKNVKAWMPLPEPYKAESEEEE